MGTSARRRTCRRGTAFEHGALAALLLGALLAHAFARAQTLITSSPDLAVDVAAADGELVIGLLGGLWTVPAAGGAATLLLDPSATAATPRWSADKRRILYSARAGGRHGIYVIDTESRERHEVETPALDGRHPVWHPDGERIAFAAPRTGSGLDLFEADLSTGLRWRLTSSPGDETEPAWSHSGRNLAYVAYDGETWSLMLRRFGENDVELLRSTTAIAAPAWRPDGTLITFYRETAAGPEQQMAIVSEPPLIRTLLRDDRLARAPLRWRDRERFVYVAGGRLHTRAFDGRASRPLDFRAQLEPAAGRTPVDIANRSLPEGAAPGGPLVVRAGRVFDGLSQSYRSNVDVFIDRGLIAEIAPRKDWGDTPLIDLPDTTLMPGFIDAYAELPAGDPASVGAYLLSWGVTTIVSADYSAALAASWETAATPGPRLLPIRRVDETAEGREEQPFLVSAVGTAGDETAARVDEWRRAGRPVIADGWLASRDLGTNALLGADTVPATPGLRGATNVIDAATLVLVSGLGDAGTPGLSSLFAARQASGLDDDGPGRRLQALPNLTGRSGALVVGSLPSRLPAGLALHAELRALVAAGIAAERVFSASGVNAARLLGLSGQIGEISPGARADLVLVRGDPLRSVAASKDIVGLVRDGRFFSLSSLLERRQSTVE